MNDAENPAKAVLNGTVYAYIGDAVIELLTREKLVALGIPDTGRLSRAEQTLVSAHEQSDRVELILPCLTDKELEIYRLGRNRRAAVRVKSSTPVQYRRATGFEALFGYLHINGLFERERELFDIAYGERIALIKEKAPEK